MTHHRLRPLFAVAAAAACSGALPAAAHAAGFAKPVVISGSDDASAPRAVIAPDGRTAVLWEREIKVGRRYRSQWRLATGPSPASLGRPTTVTIAGAPHNFESPAPFLLARPDGALVLCVRTGPTKGCSIAPPDGDFGPVIDVRAGKRGFSAVVRPDNSLLVVYSNSDSLPDGRITGTQMATATLSAAGVLGAERTLERSADEQAYNGAVEPVVAADGTVAIPATLPLAEKRRRLQIGLRFMAPGSDEFGPVVAIPGAVEEYNNLSLAGGRQLTVAYSAPLQGGKKNAPEVLRVLTLQPGGVFSSPAPLPTTSTALRGVGGDRVDGFPVALPDGGILAITQRSTTAEGDFDCLNPVAGEVAAGPLGAAPAAAQRLSARGQIALYPHAAALDDGTVIASWVDGAAEGSGLFRVEASVRLPGATAFSAGQRLPSLNETSGHLLASGGNTAALIWTSWHKGPTQWSGHQTVVISPYTADGRVAPQAPLPKRPGTSCDD